MPISIKLSCVTFKKASNGSVWITTFLINCCVNNENSKNGFLTESRYFTYKHLTKALSKDALCHESHFDVRNTLLENVVFEVKNAIDWNSLIFPYPPSFKISKLRPCFLPPKKIEIKYHKATNSWKQSFDTILVV